MMNNQVKKFLEFNGKTIYFLAKDGQYWIAIKPICEVLNVTFERQREAINRHNFLSQLPLMQGVVAADGKVRKMLCLPEMFIYGWLMEIKSKSPELVAYKWECYKVLYNHFHGTIMAEKEIITEQVREQIEARNLHDELMENEKYARLMEIASNRKKLNRKKSQLQRDYFNEQLALFN